MENKEIKDNAKLGLKIGLAFLIVVFILSIVINIMGWFGSAADVAKKEFGPQASLTKYEWFITSSEEIKKLDSDINVYSEKMNTMCQTNDRGTLDRISREECMIWAQEVAGLKSAYNDLVAEYNAQGSKFNWNMYNTKHIETSFRRK